MRIVIVEHSEPIRRLLRVILTEGGHQVVGEADNGAEGEAVVALTQPDGVILDDAMPVMDGLAALPRILAVCPDVTVILFASIPSNIVSEAARTLGAAVVVEKAAGVDRVIEALNG